MSTWDKIKASWEFRSLVFMTRIVGVVFFISYLIVVASDAWHWGRLKWVRSQPLSHITAVAEEAIGTVHLQRLNDWVSYRPTAERKEIIRLLDPYAGKISSLQFMTYSAWMLRDGNAEDAVFWRQYALFRLRYDGLRCGLVESEIEMGKLLAYLRSNRIQEIIDADPAIIQRSVQRVMDFDAKHPAENNPQEVCDMVKKMVQKFVPMVPRENWAAIRHTLRQVSEYRIDQMDKKSGK